MSDTCHNCGALQLGGKRERKTRAPDALSLPDMEHLRGWCKARHPWALNPPGRLDGLVEACLLHWGSKGETRASWLKTAQTWVIRTEAFGADGADKARATRPRPAEQPARLHPGELMPTEEEKRRARDRMQQLIDRKRV